MPGARHRRTGRGPRRRPPLGVVLPLATLVVLVGAQLSTAGHFVLVAHHVCAAHGVLHHGDAGEHHHAAEPAPEPAASGPHALAAHDDTQDHDECTVAGRADSGAILAPPSPRAAPITSCHVAATGVRDRDVRPVALLRLAPKQSPPPRA